MKKPIARVVVDTVTCCDEIGIYEEDGMLVLILFDYQGGAGEYPKDMAGPLGHALLAIAGEGG